jgi:hypothetical protein
MLKMYKPLKPLIEKVSIMKRILLTLIMSSLAIPLMGMQMDQEEKSNGIPLAAKLVFTVGTLIVDTAIAPCMPCSRMNTSCPPRDPAAVICCSQTAALWECDENETCRAILSCGLPPYQSLKMN